MEEQKVMSHIIKGVLISLVMIVIGLAGYFAKLNEQSWFGWACNGVLLIFIIWACSYYATQKNGMVTFGNVFAHGFKTSAIIAIILVLYTILSLTVIFPESKDKAIEIARQKMEEKGNLTQDQMDNAIDITKRFFVPIAAGAVLLGTIIFGAIGSLIGAAVAKKKPINPVDQLNL